jgi:hypothetical protein
MTGYIPAGDAGCARHRDREAAWRRLGWLPKAPQPFTPAEILIPSRGRN